MRGGHNRTHGTVEHFPRLDSFRMGTGHRIMVNGVQLAMTAMPNPYGGERAFFLCPHCGRRARFLYWRWSRWLCQRCARLNHKSQQAAHNSFQPYERAVSILQKRLNVQDIPIPAELPGFLPDKPPWMRWATFEREMCRVRHLADEYALRSLSELYRLIGHQ